MSSTPTATAALTCFEPAWHLPHRWTYGGTVCGCSGIPDPALQGSDDLENRCTCTDPLCPDSVGRPVITDTTTLTADRKD